MRFKEEIVDFECNIKQQSIVENNSIVQEIATDIIMHASLASLIL